MRRPAGSRRHDLDQIPAESVAALSVPAPTDASGGTPWFFTSSDSRSQGTAYPHFTSFTIPVSASKTMFSRSGR
jgi:hypothetical protein